MLSPTSSSCSVSCSSVSSARKEYEFVSSILAVSAALATERTAKQAAGRALGVSADPDAAAARASTVRSIAVDMSSV